MIWPGVLMSTAMFTTMHKSENKTANGWRVTRYRFFICVWIGAFVWYFIPGLIFPALSYFNVITWFAPDDIVIANLVSHQSPFELSHHLLHTSSPDILLLHLIPSCGCKVRMDSTCCIRSTVLSLNCSDLHMTSQFLSQITCTRV